MVTNTTHLYVGKSPEISKKIGPAAAKFVLQVCMTGTEELPAVGALLETLVLSPHCDNEPDVVKQCLSEITSRTSRPHQLSSLVLLYAKSNLKIS